MPEQTMEDEQKLVKNAPYGVGRDVNGELYRFCPDRYRCWHHCEERDCFRVNGLPESTKEVGLIW